MKRIYFILIIVLFVFSFGHFLYTFLEHPEFGEPQLWFFSGGLAMLYGGIINFLNFKLQNALIRRCTVMSNIVLLIFSGILCIAIPEIQVYILTLVLLGLSITSAYAKNAPFTNA